MTKTRELRVKAFNNWPAETIFPVQQQYIELLARSNTQVPIIHCVLGFVDDKEFHHYIAHLLDGLDALPRRPDWAFESFYIPLEVEMIRVKTNSGNTNASRFIEYKNFLKMLNGSIIDEFAKFLSLIPLQLCEFAVSRILSAKAGNLSTDQQLLKRTKDALGTNFFDAFCVKYLHGNSLIDLKLKSENQRKAGGLLKLLVQGASVNLAGASYQFDEVNRIGIISSIILPSIRNDRFHGSVFPSFRSSMYKLKHYAGSQFASTAAFILVLISIFERWPSCVSEDALIDTIKRNAQYLKVFSKIKSKNKY